MTSCFNQFNESDSVENTVMSVDDCFPCSEINNENSYKEVDFQNISYYEVDLERILLVLNHPSKLYFSGSLYVECLSGAVDIHGYTLRPENGPYLVLSGYGQSAMCLSSIGEDNGIGVNDHKYMSESKRKIFNSFLEQPSPKSSIYCVLLLSKTDDLPINDVLKLDKFQCFRIPKNSSFSYFEKLENWLGCMFDFSSGDRIPQKMKYDPCLRTLAANCLNLGGPRVMICGGKGVGKSTSLQYLVNKLFKKWSLVVVIDFDIGQPEFSIPGCMSVVLIQKPILSPYFNNFYQPLRSIVVGHVNLDHCLTTYFNAVEELHRYCSLNEDIHHLPWLINTMGYIKGFGLPVLSKINFLFNPTYVLQINSSTEPSLNVLPLTPENVHKMLELSIGYNSFPLLNDDFRVPDNYSLVLLPAQKLKNAMFIPPRVSREIRVYSYMILNGILSDTSIIWTTLKHKSQKEIRRFNKNRVIAICTPFGRRSFMQCVGYGIVLARKGDEVFFQTPLQEDIFINAPHYDIFALELGLRNSSWDGINLLYPNENGCEEIIVLENTSGNFDFLF